MKKMIRIGLLIGLVGILFCMGALMNIGDTSTRTYSSASISPQGNFNAIYHFTSKQFEFKVILPDDSEAEFNIYNTYGISKSDTLPEPVLSVQLDKTKSFGFKPSRRGFYIIQLINKQETSLNYEITAYQSSGLQRDFLTDGMILTAVGMIMFYGGFIFKNGIHLFKSHKRKRT